MSDFDLEDSLGLRGKVAIVTGAASGIGLEVAWQLYQRGVRVVASDIDSARLEQALGACNNEGMKLSPADLNDIEAISSLVNQAEKHFGALHILVNCGGFIKRLPLEDVDVELWQTMMDVNLRAQFFLSRSAISVMKKTGGGRVICFSSQAAHTGGLAESAVYAISKGGILTMVKSLAREYAKHRITVNCIAPGIVRTPMITDTLSAEDQERIVASIPIGRMTETEEVARAVLFLASDWAASITGQVLDVNGGMLMR
jgi:3-oxoacyl-[acyl-carrier protein] reductase